MENKNKGKIITIIILLIMVLGLLGYLCYHILIEDVNKTNEKNSKIEKLEQTVSDLKTSKNEKKKKNELITNYLVNGKFDTSIIDEDKLKVTYYSPANASDGINCTNEIKIYNIDLVEKNNYLTTFEAKCDNKDNDFKLYGIIKDANGKILFHSLTDINGLDSNNYSYKEVFYLDFNESFDTIDNGGSLTTFSTLFKDSTMEQGLNGATGKLKGYIINEK